MQANKTLLLRWCIWFFLGNALIFWLIGLNYLPALPWLDSTYFTPSGKTILKMFITFAFVGHLGLLVLLPSIIVAPLIFIFSKKRYVFVPAIIFITALATLLLVDTLTYKLYHFHLNGVIIDLFLHGFGGEAFGFSLLEYVAIISAFIALLLIESFYAILLWRYFITKKFFKGLMKWPVIFIILSLYLSYGMIIYSHQLALNRVFVDLARVLPFYTEFLGAILPVKNGHHQIESIAESYLTQPSKASAPLNYPLTTMEHKSSSKPFNIVMIVIDAWRFDMLNKEVSPNLVKFSEKSAVFSHHSSGGNATGPGIFSLFYGLPNAYWTAMESQHRGPLLIDELIKQNYKISIFSSAGIYLPAFYRTVFQSIKDMSPYPQPGKNPYERDQIVTKNFLKFLENNDTSKHRFFSFLFYDAAHSYCAFDQDAKPLSPTVRHCNRAELTNQSDPRPYFNRYKNALILIDQQIKKVLAALEEKHLLENTIVIVTGDHGEEFNDNHMGFWGHASNFTHYQTATPLIVYWPRRKPAIYTHATSHFDVAPTLMKKVLGIKTPPEKYSLGQDLFEAIKPKPYLIIGSYTAYGIVEADRITYISPIGSYHIEQLNGRQNPELKINEDTLRFVFQDLRRFYKK